MARREGTSKPENKVHIVLAQIQIHKSRRSGDCDDAAIYSICERGRTNHVNGELLRLLDIDDQRGYRARGCEPRFSIQNDPAWVWRGSGDRFPSKIGNMTLLIKKGRLTGKIIGGNRTD